MTSSPIAGEAAMQRAKFFCHTTFPVSAFTARKRPSFVPT